MARWIRVAAAVVGLLFSALLAECEVRHYKFNVELRNTTRMCSTKPIVTVNGEFPGPTIVAREDDTLLVKVVNHVKYNVSIHWATVHGAIVILPKLGVPYPFPKPDGEKVIVLGEWWKSDVEAVINEAMKSGLAPNVSDAHTINGHPGPTAGCPSERGFNLLVEPGKKYMLRIINAALNDELFYKIARHHLTVVEVDAAYVKPFTTDTILVAPGQTTNAILSADKPAGNYLVTVSPFMDSPIAVDNLTATALIRYSTSLSTVSTTLTAAPPQNATPIANKFTNSLRSLNSRDYPARVPATIDHSLLFTVGLGVNPCPTCINGSRVVADFNNVTFVLPKIALLQAHYFNIGGVFSDDFPGNPPIWYNFTGVQPVNLRTTTGTRVYRLPYNSTVELVMQDTGMLGPENHPIHLHGFNFFAVGRGLGNYNPNEDPKKFNLIDPVERNTIGVPSGGWTAIRFRADNPGVWFLHCHLEVHTTWGLKMAFLVDNGNGPNESLLPPPSDLPKC
ncbi:hypothetical protein Nepgr_000141 [Nepenthes gracilis]|uniref:Laccase n=1 Tax=Nepenthes gracilis TaxID=150966 RepID=A0AAD3P3F4_NEPGR|nr:hypothetical protein Nepgr_000141 [Nepenthes gracilis]